jgi:hypothetical protein
MEKAKGFTTLVLRKTYGVVLSAWKKNPSRGNERMSVQSDVQKILGRKEARNRLNKIIDLSVELIDELRKIKANPSPSSWKDFKNFNMDGAEALFNKEVSSGMLLVNGNTIIINAIRVIDSLPIYERDQETIRNFYLKFIYFFK